MKRTMGGAALLAAAVALAPMPVDAQVGPRAQRGMVAQEGGPGVEMILRQRERLELTDAQVAQLDKIRQELVAQRTAHQAEMAELRSKVRAGELEPAALREQLQARRDSAQELRTRQRERVEAILTDAQKQKVETWGAMARGFQMGRRSALRGGQGWGPGMGPGMQPGAGMRGRMQRMAPGFRGWGMRRGPGMGRSFGPPGDTIPPGPGTGRDF
jgi:Spy/CpxP family protein refolding chaperone